MPGASTVRSLRSGLDGVVPGLRARDRAMHHVATEARATTSRILFIAATACWLLLVGCDDRDVPNTDASARDVVDVLTVPDVDALPDASSDDGDAHPDAAQCVFGQRRPCFFGLREAVGVGPCVMGYEGCFLGCWGGRCYESVLPAEELCNGIDDDCDGLVDELSQRCGVGACATTTVTLHVIQPVCIHTVPSVNGAGRWVRAGVDGAGRWTPDPLLRASCSWAPSAPSIARTVCTPTLFRVEGC